MQRRSAYPTKEFEKDFRRLRMAAGTFAAGGNQPGGGLFDDGTGRRTAGCF